MRGSNRRFAKVVAGAAGAARLPLLVLALELVLLQPRPAAAQDVGLPIGSRPEAVEVEDLDGAAVSLGEYIGKQPVILEFWATWCPLCSELEPGIVAVQKRHGDAIAVVQVAVGVNQSPRSIRRHTARHPQPGRLLFDPKGKATRAFKAPSTSYIVALDRRGRVVYTGVGGDQDLLAAAAKALGR